jgi:glycosyltransferase involved in cell wall biosynthesis
VNGPLRIALIASNSHPIAQPFAGGLEAHVWHLVRGLEAAGHDVTLFAAPGSDAALGCTYLKADRIQLSAAAKADVAMPPAKFMADHHAYLKLMTELAGPAHYPFDVIHNHSLHYLPIAQAPTLSTPMVCTMHTPPTPWLESAIAVTGGAGVRFVAVSRHTAQAWSHLLPGLEVVPNGVDVDVWQLGTGGEHLVWFGRITPEKGTHLAIGAARRARRSLLLAGPISDAGYFRDDVAPLLDDRVRYVGHLPQQELAVMVGGAAAALVTPVWDEPYGLVVAEAMACGTPVVAFARGGIPEVVDDSSGRLVTPGDVAAMAAAIPDVLDVDRMQVRARAVSHCSAHTMLTNYLRIYDEVIVRERVGNCDRLLHPSPRQRPPHPSTQHLRAAGSAGHRADIDCDAGNARVRARDCATA